MNIETEQRRAYERVPFFCQVRVTPRDGGLSVEARTFDVSLGGVGLGFRGSMQVRTGSLVSMAFRLIDSKRGPCEEVVVGRVARVGVDSDGIMLGVEFLEPLRADTHPKLTRTIDRL